MKLVESFVTKNPCYTSGKKRTTTKGFMIHSVGTPQPKASVFLTTWNKTTCTNVCVHAVIDGNDGTIYQCLPWDRRGWHAGKGLNGSSNDYYIGVEMCEPSTIKYTSGSAWTDSNPTKTKEVVKRTYDSAVELFAFLCKQYNLNPLNDGVIISHSEGYKRGIASNHGDVEHIWNKMGLTMEQFRKDIAAKVNADNKKTSTVTEKTSTTTSTVKTSEDIAKEIVSGKWGNNPDRKKKVEATGYCFEYVQDIVDVLMGRSKKKTVTEVAREVYKGNWGNGTDRKKKLEAAGWNYQYVQDEVARVKAKG